MSQEIESVKPILTVIDDEGDLVLSSTGPRGKAMAQAVLTLANSSRKITIIADGEMKVMKRNRNGVAPHIPDSVFDGAATRRKVSIPVPTTPDGPDIQDQYAADLEAGITGEQATGEVPAPTPGPSDPVRIPSPRRKPQIFQDAAAPPAPELAEAEMDRLLQEAALADQEVSRVQEQQRFQQQQAVQAGAEATDVAEVKPSPRKREPRSLATSGRPCGRCLGNGQIIGEAGFTGACPVCLGQGTVKTWDRSLKVR